MSSDDLKKIGQLVDQKLASVNQKLDALSASVNQKLDALSADVYRIDQTSRATYDFVKVTYENNKREIDEIKENLKLPKMPSVLDSLKTA